MADVKPVPEPAPAPVSTQPKTTAPMVAVGNKNTLNRPIAQDGKREWSYDLFDFFSVCGNFCFTCCCPCYVYSKDRQRFRSLQDRGVPLPTGSEERYDEHFWIYCGLMCTGYSWILQIRNREEIRERYGIRGSPTRDCFASGCCNPCALMQERREIELEENSFQ